RARRGDLLRDPGEREAVDVERERAERERHEPRPQGDRIERDEEGAVRLQPRRTTSRDCGGSVAACSRIDSVGRTFIARPRRTSEDAIDATTTAAMIAANTERSVDTGIAWPKTRRTPRGRIRKSAATPRAVPTAPAKNAAGTVSRIMRRRNQPFP